MITRIEIEYMEAVKKIAREMAKPQEIDWEQRRYDIAKDILAANAAQTIGYGRVRAIMEVQEAVMYADMLIAELQKPTNVKAEE